MEEISYRHIFRTTFLFGFVQVFNILVKVGSNKAIAIFLGAEGMGIFGLFNSTILLLKTGFGLGIAQSSIRDISEANDLKNEKKLSRILESTKKAILFSSLLGILITLILSQWLSRCTFGATSYTIAFIWLALVVGMNILTEGQLGILTGMRQLRSLAKASMIGSAVGFAAAVPSFYFLGKAGIVPSLIITATSAFLFSNFFVRKIKYESPRLKIKELIEEAVPFVKMGIALMLVSFFYSISFLIINSYIRHSGGLSEVGYYQAGTTIISGYFGIIITAITTDFYPRIAAMNKHNHKINEELNKQSLVSLVFTSPLIIAFLFLLSNLVRLLYSKSFLPTIDYVSFAVFGMLFKICSNPVEMILVVKFQIKIYLLFEVIYRIIEVLLNIYFYKLFGLKGLGICYLIMGVLHFIVIQIMAYKLYNIKYSALFAKIFTFVLSLTLLAAFVNSFDNEIIRYIIGFSMTFFSLIISIIIAKKVFNLSIFEIVLSKIGLKR
jgi:PST family polysaccharide transporter